MDGFTWSIQKAGYEFSQADEMGTTDYENFIQEFTNFPWLDQIEEAQNNPIKSAPTLSVKDLKTGKDFWVSMSGNRNDHGYLIGYIYPRERKSLLGLGNKKIVRWLEIYLTNDTELVKMCFDDFFNRDYNSLESKIGNLELYDEMVAKDLAK